MTNDELKTVLTKMGEHHNELTTKLSAVEALLKERGQDAFSEVVLSGMVDDILHYQMQIKDMSNFITRLTVETIRGIALERLITSTFAQAIKP